jgi:prolyl-tRNA synthetase
MIGAIIMVHGDDDGLVLPPKVSPIQVAILPIAQHKEGVLEKANELKEMLQKDFRVKLDDSDHAPGWKFAEYEMKGVPVRVEIGPKDIEKGQCVIVRRDTREKIFVPLENLSESVAKALQDVHDAMYEKALKNMQEKTNVATTYDEFIQLGKEQGGFIKAMWCGDAACEEKLKEDTSGVKSRCIPFEEEHLADTCVCCGKPAKHMVYWGKQY